ncbi:MAG: phytoene desaturase family protein, partial [Candidatus Acidiferrales bacterium]
NGGEVRRVDSGEVHRTSETGESASRSTSVSREASPVCHSEPGRPLSANGGEEPAFPSVASPQNWPSQREALADAVIKTLAEYAPDLPSKIIAARVITSLDLEETYGLTGGHISHGELALDQLFTMRPLIGWSRYRTPVRGLFLCGPGTHPGTGLTGASALNASREITKSLRR